MPAFFRYTADTCTVEVFKQFIKLFEMHRFSLVHVRRASAFLPLACRVDWSCNLHVGQLGNQLGVQLDQIWSSLGMLKLLDRG